MNIPPPFFPVSTPPLTLNIHYVDAPFVNLELLRKGNFDNVAVRIACRVLESDTVTARVMASDGDELSVVLVTGWERHEKTGKLRHICLKRGGEYILEGVCKQKGRVLYLTRFSCREGVPAMLRAIHDAAYATTDVLWFGCKGKPPKFPGMRLEHDGILKPPIFRMLEGSTPVNPGLI